MIAKLKSLISYAALLVTKDDGNFRVSTVRGMSKQGDVVLITPYGFDHNPPVGSLAVVLQIQGNEGNRAAIACYQQKRERNLKPGESAVGNYLTGSKVVFKENGDIDITCNGNININCTGDVNVVSAGDINLGGLGGPAVARVGDLVNVSSGSSTGLWPIVSGSGKVNAI